MKKILMAGILVSCSTSLFAFCGFYVSKASGTLSNKTSQVILARDGRKTVVTMYNDFKGNIRDFAMVIPVPVLLQKKDIRVVEPGIFQRLNDYSSPRLVEYYDVNPCMPRVYEKDDLMSVQESVVMKSPKAAPTARGYGVTIEAQYLVGEYDILILGAKESSGLQRWLSDNGYKIPESAEEVLEPYIKSNLKMFVTKDNPKQATALNNGFLRPIQISFASEKFILPIRLGMANADGDQDLVIYGLTRRGRIECTNYRNIDIPSDRNIPLFVKKNFGAFYSNLFQHQWNNEGRNLAFLEYAWDITPINPMKCDPCVGNPPTQQELLTAGAWWLKQADWSDYSDPDMDLPDGNNQTFFTRMYGRYNRNDFPQDLAFQVTPNRNHYQARYIVTHPANGDLSCDEGRTYLRELKARRKKELRQLLSLTGTNMHNWQKDLLSSDAARHEPEIAYAHVADELKNETETEGQGAGMMAWVSALMIGSAGFLRWKGMI